MSTAWIDDLYLNGGGSILDVPKANAIPDDVTGRAIRFDCLRLAIGLGIAKNADELIACARAMYAFVNGERFEKLERFANWLDEPVTRPTEDERQQARERQRARGVADDDMPNPDDEPTGDERSFEWLELPVRALNCLKDAGYETIGEVRAATDKELLAIHNLGRHTLDDIRSALAQDRRRQDARQLG